MSVNTIDSVFEGFKNLRVLVVGDVMVDSYIWGSADRISPEAPVPVVKTVSKEYRLGGAANVALNLDSLGATPVLCAVIGKDEDGDRFMDRLKIRKIDGTSVVRSDYRSTTVKTRVLSGYQHIVRIDSENETPLSENEEKKLFEKISGNLNKVDAVIFEDYDKGTITKSLITNVLDLTNRFNIPTIVDPKRNNFFNYQGASVFKPNLKELREALKLHDDLATLPEISAAVTKLQKEINVKEIFLTLSDKGVFVRNSENEIHIPAHIRTISDVSGAGDTVISIIALCKAMGLNSTFTAELANLGGGLVCEYVGVVPVEKNKLFEEAKKYEIVKSL